MELNLLSHQKTLGTEISKSLRSGKYSDFKVAVAYARDSAISRIYNDLTEFAKNGGKTSVIAGIDQGNTSYQALVNMKTFAKDSLYIHHDRNINITFHPKVYLFGNQETEKIIVGSSNFTAGGFFLNYEANIEVTLDNSESAVNFKKQISDYWGDLLKDENTKLCELPLLDELLEQGSVIDESQQKLFKAIVGKISYDLPFTQKQNLGKLPPLSTLAPVLLPKSKKIFAMTLSGFDVSPKSQDPVILIPIAALKSFPNFWNFPKLYTYSSSGYLQLYASAKILIDTTPHLDQHLRIYYYEKKSEFRLQCEAIKRNGKEGDIITIEKSVNNPMGFLIELVRINSPKYNQILALLGNKVSSKKYFGYY